MKKNLTNTRLAERCSPSLVEATRRRKHHARQFATCQEPLLTNLNYIRRNNEITSTPTRKQATTAPRQTNIYANDRLVLSSGKRATHTLTFVNRQFYLFTFFCLHERLHMLQFHVVAAKCEECRIRLPNEQNCSVIFRILPVF